MFRPVGWNGDISSAKLNKVLLEGEAADSVLLRLSLDSLFEGRDKLHSSVWPQGLV